MKTISEKLIVPDKRNGINKIRNSKLYEPQMKKCTKWTSRKSCTYSVCAIYLKILNHKFNSLYIYIYRKFTFVNFLANE